MSLFNDISKALTSGGGLTGSINKAVGGSIQDAASSVFGAGPISRAVGSVATGAATGAFNQLTRGYTRQINAVGGAIGEALNGNFQNGAARLLDSGLIPGAFGLGAQALLYGTPTPLLGGLSMSEAMAIHADIAATSYAKKHLFLLEVVGNADGDFSERFNFFAIGIDYGPVTLSGEKHKIGAAHVDSVNSADPTELRISTLDDADGTIKSWFDAHSGLCVRQDGTVGLPAEYAVKISILHSSLKPGGGYQYKGWFRPAGIEYSLSRRENGLEEINLTFMQLDTFFDGA